MLQMSRLDWSICRMIAARTARGETIAKIAKDVELPKARLTQLARISGIRYRQRRPNPDEVRAAISQVEKGGLTFRAAAVRCGLSKTAIHRFVQERRKQLQDSAGPEQFQDKPGYCPVHGPILVSPCVACAALAAKN